MDRAHRVAARYGRAARGAQVVRSRGLLCADEQPVPVQFRQEARSAPATRYIGMQDPVELLLATGVVSHRWVDTATVEAVEAALLEGVYLAVGGPEAFAGMDFAPLPDEPFAWERVPAGVHDRVAEALLLIDRCAEMFFGFGVEVRTACRRLLADAVASEPAIMRRGRVETAAAAVMWAIAKGNGFIGRGRALRVDIMLSCFHVSGSVTQRATTILEAVGAPARRDGTLLLGSVRYLTADRRRGLFLLAQSLAPVR